MPATPSWADYFNQNMAQLGLPTPEGLFDSLTTAMATIGTLEELVRTFGPKVTINELIRAGTISDKLLVAGAMTASAYIGASIGSAFVATTRSLTGGLGLEDLWIAIDQWPSTWPKLDVDGYWYLPPAMAPVPIDADFMLIGRAIAGQATSVSSEVGVTWLDAAVSSTEPIQAALVGIKTGTCVEEPTLFA